MPNGVREARYLRQEGFNSLCVESALQGTYSGALPTEIKSTLTVSCYWHPVRGLIAVHGTWSNAVVHALFGFAYDRVPPE